MVKIPVPIAIAAPFAGWLRRLEAVPDPVFAQRMLGDGIAIDPLEGVLRAPCDGRVIAIAGSAHAITIETANGAQLLIHIGIDTVALGGAGFALGNFAVGDRVKAGDQLIEFDLDLVAQRAKSLITPIVIANSGYTLVAPASGRVAAGDVIMQIAPEPAPGDRDGGARPTLRLAGTVVITIPHGLHARPAALVVAALKPLAAGVELQCKGRTASAHSIVAMLTLGAAKGDAIAITATGEDASTAFQKIAAVIGGPGQIIESRSAAARTERVENHNTSGQGVSGIGASPGLGIGPVFQLRVDDLAIVEQRDTSPVTERAILERARQMISEIPPGASAAGAAIAAAHLSLLDDPEILDRAHAAIDAGKTAAFAWRSATRALAERIEATGNTVMIERIADMHDLERRLVTAIVTGSAALPAKLPAGAIVVADEIPPSLLLGSDIDQLAGIVTARGGPTSHAAILAAAAGIPMLVATGASVCALPSGSMAILDADAGNFDPDPSPEAIKDFRRRIAKRANATASDNARASEPCRLADGCRIEIFANLGSVEDARRAVTAGAEGCGLLRTEFLFLDRDTAPTEAEQIAAYQAIAAELQNRPLIVRTLDVGADKPLRYLPQPPEDNPALGQRGLRLALATPDLLAGQLRAILLATAPSQCRIMLPMVVDRDELRAARAILDAVRSELGIADVIALGVMIETPAAALLAESLAAEADFLSIGTNDLTQYALAADRGNPAVAAMVDALHPGVLRLVAMACSGARAYGRQIGVCGGLAADPFAAVILVGLGVTELSVPPLQIGAVKARLRNITLADCQQLAAKALACATAPEVRALVAENI
jgi:phosphoenolpyruvate-protein phosphotransferase